MNSVSIHIFSVCVSQITDFSLTYFNAGRSYDAAATSSLAARRTETLTSADLINIEIVTEQNTNKRKNF